MSCSGVFHVIICQTKQGITLISSDLAHDIVLGFHCAYCDSFFVCDPPGHEVRNSLCSTTNKLAVLCFYFIYLFFYLFFYY